MLIAVFHIEFFLGEIISSAHRLGADEAPRRLYSSLSKFARVSYLANLMELYNFRTVKCAI